MPMDRITLTCLSGGKLSLGCLYIENLIVLFSHLTEAFAKLRAIMCAIWSANVYFKPLNHIICTLQ